jgi:hypothetical protein
MTKRISTIVAAPVLAQNLARDHALPRAPVGPRSGPKLAAVVAMILGAAIVVALGSGAGHSGAAAPLPGAHGRVAAQPTLPLAFVANAGQVDSRARYYAQGSGYGFYFTRREAALSFVQGRRGAAHALHFVGASPAVVLQARGRLAGTVNYMVGANRAKWHTGLPSYREVVYRGLWPGIDMTVRGRGGALKYEFLVRAGARVGDIRLAYRGAKSLTLSPGGSLLIGTGLGTLKDSRPVSYQRTGGRRVSVASHYALRAHDGYGFALGAGYDSRHSVIIDPGLDYSTYLGGVSRDVGIGVAVDRDGSAYVSGVTSAGFPTTPGAFQLTNPGTADGFVAKLNPAGSALVYSTYLGGSDEDFPNDIAVDQAGNAFLTGQTYSSDFPTTPAAFQAGDPDPTAGDVGADAFVTKLNPSGTALVYSTYLGGSSEGLFDSLNGIEVDRAGNAYVAGSVCTSSFPTTPGAFQPGDPSPGPCDPDVERPDNNTPVVSKLNAAGSALVYSTYLGGKSFANLNGLTVDKEGNVYVTGPVDGDFPTTPHTFQAADPAPGTDAFVTKLNAAGSALTYSTYLGGSSDDEGGLGIGVDEGGFAYVAGRTGSSDFPLTRKAYDTTLSGEDDAFVTKLNRTGTALVYSTLLGGSGFEEPHFSVAIDDDGRAYVMGTTDSTDFPTTPGASQPTYGGGSLDAFVTRLNTTGSALDGSTYLGGNSRDVASNIALDRRNRAYVTGSTSSTNFPATAGAFQSSDPDPAGRDAFLTKLDLGGD